MRKMTKIQKSQHDFFPENRVTRVPRTIISAASLLLV